MKWVNVEPDIRSIDVGVLTNSLSVIDAIALLCLSNTSPLVVLHDGASVKIERHLSARQVELGGLLIGKVYSMSTLDDGIVVIEIDDAIACVDFDSTAVSLSMSPDVWQKADAVAADEQCVVGWYHSHPNLGAFFSSTDRWTQKNFFRKPYSLGLVVDPVRREEKWFRGEDSVEVGAEFVLRVKNELAVG